MQKVTGSQDGIQNLTKQPNYYKYMAHLTKGGEGKRC